MNEKKLVFVYGSLLSGGSGNLTGALGNHRVLSNGNFLGEHTTAPKFHFVSLGAFPGAIENGKTAIVGEVYEVTDDIFKSLDLLEGYPSFYGRKQIDTIYGKAWIYLLPESYLGNHTKIPSGNWRDFINFMYG